LPAGVRRLLHLAEAVPEKKGARKEEAEYLFSNAWAFRPSAPATLWERMLNFSRDERYLCPALPHEGALPPVDLFL